MKTTMKKTSPMKQTMATVKSKKTIMPEGKPNAATIKVTKTTKATKTPTMQMKKSGMGKKC